MPDADLPRAAKGYRWERYVPGRRSYPELPHALRAAWEAIVPSYYPFARLEYRPCSASLHDGSTLPCVYVMAAQSYIDAWGVWPGEDARKREVSIDDVVAIGESQFRLPPRFANVIYEAGETRMGASYFTLLFSDGSRQPYVAGNAVDFVTLPSGKSAADIIDVAPHVGADADPISSEEYVWCLFGVGESDRSHLRCLREPGRRRLRTTGPRKPKTYVGGDKAELRHE